MLAVILLATYNGARFLPAQLDSLLAQRYPHWLLLAKDDGSSDNSQAILQDYARRHPHRLRYLGVSAANRGPLRLFSDLMQYVLDRERQLGLDDYCIGFCDQDDLWHRDKLQLAVERLQNERAAGAEHLLVHHELRVIDVSGAPLAERFSTLQGFDPVRCELADLIRVNVVSGCGALLTPGLARRCVPVPDAAAMYDWWIALVASQCGRISFIDRPLLAYRQHGGNAVGVQPTARHLPLLARIRVLMSAEKNRDLTIIARQARYLYRHSLRPLNRRERLICRLTGWLAMRNLALRLLILKLLQLVRRYDPPTR